MNIEFRETIKPEISLDEYSRQANEEKRTYGMKSLDEYLKTHKICDNIEEEWCLVEWDEPQIGKGKIYVSIDIDILLTDGTVIYNGFFNHSNGRYYDGNGHILKDKNVRGWKTHYDGV